MFKNILVAFDGSPNSILALDISTQIAKKFRCEITLIYVVSLDGFAMPRIDKQLIGIEAWVKLAHQRGETILKEGEEIAFSRKLVVNTLLKEGHIVEEIIKTAEEKKIDLLILGARGLSHIKEILLGSVSAGVTRHARCPVLVAK
jgi:nucleotide-binding universal stress UspA family protein